MVYSGERYLSEEKRMKQADILLWALLILVVGAILWLAFTGQLQAVLNLFVGGFWNFYENILRSLRR